MNTLLRLLILAVSEAVLRRPEQTSLSDEDRARRVAAKRFNERLKLIANLLNTSAAALIGAALLIPLVQQDTTILWELWPWLWFLIAVLLHMLGHVVLSRMRSED